MVLHVNKKLTSCVQSKEDHWILYLDSDLIFEYTNIKTICCVCYMYPRKQTNKSSLKNTVVLILVWFETLSIRYHIESNLFVMLSLRKVAGVNILLPFFPSGPVLFNPFKGLHAVPWSDSWASSKPARLDSRCTVICLALGSRN